MLTLIATCLLAAGTTFTPLPEWTITEIVGGGIPSAYTHNIPLVLCYSGRCPEPDYRTRITMQRSLAPGHVAESPQGCTLKIQGKE